MERLLDRVCERTGLGRVSVGGCVRLLDDGNTIPFIARYRKEATGALDEVQIRAVEEAWREYRETEARKKTILETIDKAGKLTGDLRRRIESCLDRNELEDMYLPFKPRKSTRADKARKAGLEPLAEMILGRRPAPSDRSGTVNGFVNPDLGVATFEEALAGAEDIVSDLVSANGEARAAVRDLAFRSGAISARRKRGASPEADTFSHYFEYREPVRTVASHRFLAVRRGEAQGGLVVSVSVDDARGIQLASRPFLGRVPHAYREDFEAAVTEAWDRLLWPSMDREVLSRVEKWAHREAVSVFENNLRSLLMEPPLTGRRVLGVDPGFRNGCKMACVDATGRVLQTATIYPHEPRGDREGARRIIVDMVTRHRLDVLAVGDGTAHRETLTFLESIEWPDDVKIESVSEAGASVYSASEVAGRELPGMDVTLRGAVSIARRLQDPLAELVKIDPRSIGVGQYQHDVDQKMLERGLDAVVEECVNRVGVDVNTASPSLLRHVAGIGPILAGAMVKHRDVNGPFSGRAALQKVPGLGPARFTQCGGFLRIRDGAEQLDVTGVHPERYGLVRRMVRAAGVELRSVLGHPEVVRRLADQAVDRGDAGDETIKDIFAELEKPGLDPRGIREGVRFAEGIHTIEDLETGMVLPGKVTNVTDFGLFVDIGVHRDGLVHVSRMADRPVGSPFDVARPQQAVTVLVVDVDLDRNRISLSMKPSEVGSPG
ncbi:MAG: RNA-binding transcriptional accessory protein [Deltaproteobacteria bacterium]|nr:RNA-binding transcriptional accessory protein [Deltaproteobacteria bacterium]